MRPAAQRSPAPACAQSPAALYHTPARCLSGRRPCTQDMPAPGRRARIAAAGPSSPNRCLLLILHARFPVLVAFQNCKAQIQRGEGEGGQGCRRREYTAATAAQEAGAEGGPPQKGGRERRWSYNRKGEGAHRARAGRGTQVALRAGRRRGLKTDGKLKQGLPRAAQGARASQKSGVVRALAQGGSTADAGKQGAA